MVDLQNAHTPFRSEEIHEYQTRCNLHWHGWFSQTRSHLGYTEWHVMILFSSVQYILVLCGDCVVLQHMQLQLCWPCTLWRAVVDYVDYLCMCIHLSYAYDHVILTMYAFYCKPHNQTLHYLNRETVYVQVLWWVDNHAYMR